MDSNTFCKMFENDAKQASKRWGNPLLHGEGFSVALQSAWEAYPRWDPRKSSLRTWLHNQMRFGLLAANQSVLNTARRSRTSKPCPKVYMVYLDEDCRIDLSQFVAPPVDVGEELDRVRKIEAVRQAVQSLPKRQRVVIEAYYFNNKSTRQIADAVGVTHQAVSLRIKKGLSLLEKKFSGVID